MRHIYILILNHPAIVLAMLSLLMIAEMGVVWRSIIPIEYDWLLRWLVILTILAWASMGGMVGMLRRTGVLRIADCDMVGYAYWILRVVITATFVLLIFSMVESSSFLFSLFLLGVAASIVIVAFIGLITPANHSGMGYSIFIIAPLAFLALINLYHLGMVLSIGLSWEVWWPLFGWLSAWELSAWEVVLLVGLIFGSLALLMYLLGKRMSHGMYTIAPLAFLALINLYHMGIVLSEKISWNFWNLSWDLLAIVLPVGLTVGSLALLMYLLGKRMSHGTYTVVVSCSLGALSLILVMLQVVLPVGLIVGSLALLIYLLGKRMSHETYKVVVPRSLGALSFILVSMPFVGGFAAGPTGIGAFVIGMPLYASASLALLASLWIKMLSPIGRKIVVSVLGLWVMYVVMGWFWIVAIDNGLRGFTGDERADAEVALDRSNQIHSQYLFGMEKARVVRDADGQFDVVFYTWWGLKANYQMEGR